MTPRTGADAMDSLSQAIAGTDSGPLAERLDDKSRLQVPGHSGFGGAYQGREAIVGVLDRMAAAMGGTASFDLHETQTSAGSALRLEGRLSGAESGGPSHARLSVVATLVGEVFRSITIECTDRSAWDALWERGPR